MSTERATDRQTTLRIESLRKTLEDIITNSHSWVITKESAHIEGPIHKKYRAIAQAGLRKDDFIMVGN